jgi:hypothetical protein
MYLNVQQSKSFQSSFPQTSLVCSCTFYVVLQWHHSWGNFHVIKHIIEDHTCSLLPHFDSYDMPGRARHPCQDLQATVHLVGISVRPWHTTMGSYPHSSFPSLHVNRSDTLMCFTFRVLPLNLAQTSQYDLSCIDLCRTDHPLLFAP